MASRLGTGSWLRPGAKFSGGRLETATHRYASRTSRPGRPAPPRPPRPTPSAAPIDTLFQQRKLPLVGAGLAALCIGLYASLLASSYLRTPAACEHEADRAPTGRPPTVGAALPGTDETSHEARQSAAAFDRGLDVPERLMGITGLRKRLAAGARGHVLEVAVGTGRNLGYYDWRGVAESDAKEVRDSVLSFTGVDISADMMSVARTRIRDSVPGLKGLMRRRRAEPMPEGGMVVDVLDSRVRLCIADAEQTLPLPAGPQKYDTVLQTFGLCSVSDPAALLSSMASVVRPGGRIVLLEHGRGRYDWVNGLLDSYAEPHFRRYGCWWNRDIEGVVRETASRVGLEVVSVERPLLLQAGTTLVMELRPRRPRQADTDVARPWEPPEAKVVARP